MTLSIGSSSVQLTLFQKNASANRFTNQATERLATGLRINRASDNPAGLIAAEQLRGDLVEISSQIKVLNAQQRQSNLQESGRQLATNVLNEVRGLLVQASSDTNSAEELEAIQLQVDASLGAIDRLGATTGFELPASLEALRSGGSANVVDGDPAKGFELLEQELGTINLARAAAGAYEKYTLDVEQRLAEDKAVATATALSQIEDAEYMRESSNLITGQILTEASVRTIALSQRIQSDQVLLLFENL